MSDLDLPRGISLVTSHGLPAYRIDTPLCTGLVYEHGAHVASWAPAGADEVLWMSDDSVFSADTAIRGGIPVCFPWFGPGRSGGMTPAHGFARLSEWYLVGASVEKGTAHLSLELTADEAGDLGGFPDDFTARLDVAMGRKLTVSLTVTAGEAPLDLEEALHTYLAVGDVREVTIEGLAGAQYLDKLDGEHHQQDGEVTFRGRTDRVYRSTATTVVDDGRRRVVVAKQGSADTVVWNPWDEVAAQMGDFTSDQWPHMCCVEAANCLDDAVTVAPGASHTMSTTISLG